MPPALFDLLFWRLEISKLLAHAGIPVPLLGRNYLLPYLTLSRACLAPGPPFPAVEFALQACSPRSSAEIAKAVYITQPAWPFAFGVCSSLHS